MKKDNIKRLKSIKWIFVLLMMSVLLYLVVGEIIMPETKLGDEYWSEDFPAEWVRVLEDGSRVPIEIPGSCEADRNERVVIEATMPEELKSHAYLCFRGARQDIDIYIDGVLRQQYSTKESRIFGKNSPAVYVFVELYAEDAGRNIQIVTQSDSSYSGVFNGIYYGDQMGIWRYLFTKYGAEVVIALLMLVFGFFAVVSSIILRFYSKKIDLVYLGLGIILAAVWLISNSAFRQLIFPSMSAINDVPFYMIMLLPFPFLLYMNGIQEGRYYRYYFISGIISLVDLFVCTVLHMTNIRDFSESIILMAMSGMVSIILIAITVVQDQIKGFGKSYRTVMVGILCFVVSAMLQMILYFCRTIPFNGSIFAVGLILLLTAATIDAIQNLSRVEREKQQAIMASESKARFLANMSHEIRTPINAVLGMDEIILKEASDDNILEYAQDIQSAGRTLLALINDILDFSKIESGKLELLPCEYGLNELLNDCYNMIFLKVKEKNLTFKIVNDPNIPERLYGDEVRIRQIMINLLTNAVKYTEKGNVTLTIGGEQTDEDTYLLEIRVKDTGIGITKENQEKMFASFQRVEESRIHHIEGTGLGLAITKQLTVMMDGEISVKSEYGKGSEFCVRFPQKMVAANPLGRFFANEVQEIGGKQVKKVVFQAPSARILVVDDVAMNLKVMKGLLKHTQIQVDIAESGKKCLEMIKNCHYNVIFLDHMMPEMDGIETLHRMKQTEHTMNESTPVIMLTANALSGAREGYLEKGFCDYLSKPIREKELLELLLRNLPTELIIRDVESAEEQETDWQDVKEQLSMLDVAEGLECCNSQGENYQEMLKMYMENDRSVAMTLLYHRQDWKNYVVQAEALRDMSLFVGAMEIARYADQLAEAVNTGDISYIYEYHDKLLMEYRALLDKLNNAKGGEMFFMK